MNRAGRATDAVRVGSARVARSAVSRASIPFWIGGALLAALLIVTVSLGGFNRADASPAQLPVGEELHLPLYSIAVLDAHLTDEIEDEFVSADDGETLVVTTVLLENHAPYPVGVGNAVDGVQSRLFTMRDSLIDLAGVELSSTPYAWRTDDSAGGVILQPRVPTEVQLVWPVPADAVSDGKVTFDVYDADETRGQVILDSRNITWRRSDLAAQITLDATEAS